MMPQRRYAAEFVQQVRRFLGRGPAPRFDHFTYWEKFDHWAVLRGTAIMGAAGLVLWFPAAASRFMPGWMFNVALFVHGAEAALAIGFIFVVHFFNGHLRPGKVPMDLVIFTGAVDEHALREERPAEYDRLIASGGLDTLAVPPAAPAVLRRSRIVGGIALGSGIVLVVLIVYAVLR